MFDFGGIQASFSTLERQAPRTIEFYFDEMVKMLDEKFGKDYAKNNPDLLAELVKACAIDFQTGASGKIFFDGMKEIKEGLEYIGDRLDEFVSLMSKE